MTPSPYLFQKMHDLNCISALTTVADFYFVLFYFFDFCCCCSFYLAHRTVTSTETDHCKTPPNQSRMEGVQTDIKSRNEHRFPARAF